MMASSRRCGSSSRKASRTLDADTAAVDNQGYMQVNIKPLESRSVNLWCIVWGLSTRFPRTEPSPWLVCSSGVIFSSFFVYHVVTYTYILHRILCAFFVPIFTLLCGYYWLSLYYRKSWSVTSIYLLSCACFVGEFIGQCLGSKTVDSEDSGADSFPRHLFSPLVHGSLLVALVASSTLSSLTLYSNASVLAFVVTARFFACTSLTDLPPSARPFVAYSCGVVGVIIAKYIETVLRSPFTSSSSYMQAQDGKIAVLRRRRTSSTSAGLSAKVRRTSLPAISLQKNHLSNSQSSPTSIDAALLAEAHGIITEMLADTSSLPQHVLSGLRTLSNLLSPPPHSTSPLRPRLGPIISLNADVTSGSETEEIPCMGEKFIANPKRCRRNLPLSHLHRMLSSTWTTTTSATGMPTLEPEPSRKRSASFRHSPGMRTFLSPPVSDANSPTYSPHLSLANDALVERLTSSKYRSYSTTSLVHLTPTARSKLSRERKTVCSLHPLTASDIRRLHSLSRAASTSTPVAPVVGVLSSGGESEAEDAETTPLKGRTAVSPGVTPPPPPPPALPPAALKRLQPTSDYESSDSPGSSDNNETTSSTTATLAILDEASRTPLQEEEDELEIPLSTSGSDGRCIILNDDNKYDLDFLETDPLWTSISEWDYPIFDVSNQSQECILSQMCYRVFLEVGFFETFKIPLLEFFNYFHSLEKGYQDKPYHNRTHAADVLHAVYYLTSQPIPGFVQLPPESDSPPPMQKTEDGLVTVGLQTRQSFNAEDTYGIMGANFPALELMALYVAAAMHDYDHPGRTNAFLVMTHAPQAVLYNDRSVLENHHAASAWSLFLSKPEYNFLVHLDKAEFKRFRFLVIEAILATDLKRHFEILAEFNTKVNDVDAPGIDWTCEADRLITMEMIIKLADISGPCKRHDLHTQWTHRIAEEFYEQGDEEQSLGLPISPFMNRRNPQLAKLQESFITHLVAPLCNSYGEAGILPGHWVDDCESDDDDYKGGSDDVVDTSDCKDTEEEGREKNDAQESPMKSRAKPSVSRKRISCLQTIHLKNNHEYWTAILKQEEEEEQQAKAEGEPSQTGEQPSEADESLPPQEEMETIHEEEVTSEKTLRFSVQNSQATEKSPVA